MTERKIQHHLLKHAIDDLINPIIKACDNKTVIHDVLSKDIIDMFYMCAGMELGIMISLNRLSTFTLSEFISALHESLEGFSEFELALEFDNKMTASIYEEVIEY